MLSKNNSSPAVCINNLLQISRGEVPYDRVKGISSAQIDGPASQAIDELVEDAEWMLETYEPRVQAEDIEIYPTDAQNGCYSIKATINTKEADT